MISAIPSSNLEKIADLPQPSRMETLVQKIASLIFFPFRLLYSATTSLLHKVHVFFFFTLHLQTVVVRVQNLWIDYHGEKKIWNEEKKKWEEHISLLKQNLQDSKTREVAAIYENSQLRAINQQLVSKLDAGSDTNGYLPGQRKRLQELTRENEDLQRLLERRNKEIERLDMELQNLKNEVTESANKVIEGLTSVDSDDNLLDELSQNL